MLSIVSTILQVTEIETLTLTNLASDSLNRSFNQKTVKRVITQVTLSA